MFPEIRQIFSEILKELKSCGAVIVVSQARGVRAARRNSYPFIMQTGA
jgi:hypothetical protein